MDQNPLIKIDTSSLPLCNKIDTSFLPAISSYQPKGKPNQPHSTRNPLIKQCINANNYMPFTTIVRFKEIILHQLSFEMTLNKRKIKK